MKQRRKIVVKTVLKGMGDVLVIAPRTRYVQFVPKDTPVERIRSHFEMVGRDIRSAMKRYGETQARKVAS